MSVTEPQKPANLFDLGFRGPEAHVGTLRPRIFQENNHFIEDP